MDILSLHANFLQVQTSAEWPEGITHTTQCWDIKHGLPQKKSSTGKKKLRTENLWAKQPPQTLNKIRRTKKRVTGWDWDVFREFSMKQKHREMSNKMESESVITRAA